MSERSPIVFENDQPITVLSTSPSVTSLTSLSTVSDSSLSTSTLSTDGAYPKRVDRAVAIQQVQQTWRVRREEREQRQSTLRTGLPKALKSKQQQLQQLHRPPPFPSLCAVVQKTWTQAFDNKPKEKRYGRADRPKVFPSMISIMQSNALVTQVRDLQGDDTYDWEYEKVDYSGSTRGSDSSRDQAPLESVKSDPSALAILPAGSNWNTAILQMTQSRSRAFLLLDLATIVRRMVLWKRTHPNITWVHSVSANTDGKLLQVLLMAGVRLATSTRADIGHALNALNKLKKSPKHQCIADSTSHTLPPDSYIREMLKAKVTSLAVDGPQEVHRLVQTVQRMQARRGDHDSYNLDLVLRLQSNPSGWMQLVESTAEAICQYPEHRLSGISFDIGSPETWKERQDHAQQVIKCILRYHDSVKINLTGFEQEPFPCEWVEWWTSMQSDARVAEVAVECSHPLVASAGALCSRIIGVRDQPCDGIIKQSLYIDEGCYGSLYQTRGEYKPIPLGRTMDSCFSSTIWGPTCDGLDRICRDIPLPKLGRNDWLVFANMGCPGSLDTAFNGFEAPETAYCVLGYFK